MNFQQIDYLLAIDKYRSFSAAAKEMFVTQPALTIQIKNLEEELGVLLFDRNKKPLEPTTIGNLYIFPSNSILAYSVMIHPYIWIG